MARSRTLKPEFWTDDVIVELSFAARLFYQGCWNFAICDQGHIDASPKSLKMKIFPADDVDPVALIDELIKWGRLVRKETPDGRTYLHVGTLAKHTKMDTRWNTRCPYCALEGLAKPVSAPPSTPDHTETRASSDEHTETRSSKGKESKGREGKENAANESRPPADELTVTQRSKRITDAYAEIVKLCKWPAINGIVIKAIQAQRWKDQEIHDALLRLAKEGRPVTVESLRVELDGLAPYPSRASPPADPSASSWDKPFPTRKPGAAS